MQVIAGAHQQILVFLIVVCSALGAASTATTTPVPGSCTPPSLGDDVDTSACVGLIPPDSCVVQCALGYELSQGNLSGVGSVDGAVTYHCYSADDGFIGSGPACASTASTAEATPGPTPAVTPAPTLAPTSAPASQNPVEVKLTIASVDFAALTANSTMYEEFSSAVVRGIAHGLGIEEKHVTVKLSAGSVRVVATVDTELPEDVEAAKTAMANAVVSEVQVVEGIDAVSTGIIAASVQELGLQTVVTSAPTSAPTPAPASPTPTPSHLPEPPTSLAGPSLGRSGSILALVAVTVTFRP